VLVGDEALEAADRQGAFELAARALAFAGGVARAPERADQRRRLEDQVERLLVLAAAHAGDVPVGLDAGRARVGTRRHALAADDGLLRYGLREGDERRPARHQVGVVLVRDRHVAGHLALPAARAGGFVHVLGLLLDPRVVADRSLAAAVGADALDLGVRQHVDVGMVDGRRHLGGRDATRAVECGEDLAEEDHLAADAGLLLDDEDLVAHVAELEGGLHAADAAADDEGVILVGRTRHLGLAGRLVALAGRRHGVAAHAAAFREGPRAERAFTYSCM